MPVFLALSCLQTRPMADAWRDLIALEPDGVQLTPGCVPTVGFQALVQGCATPVLLHHGFSWTHRKQEVWSGGMRAIGLGVRSVHPPVLARSLPFEAWLEHARDQPDLVYETMYPGYLLGDGAALLRAMDAALPLAVDISHLHIQATQGLLASAQLQAVLEYDDVREIHVSHNEGRSDSHQPLRASSYLLGWARARGQAGTPLVLESYFHNLDDAERRRQIDRIRS